MANHGFDPKQFPLAQGFGGNVPQQSQPPGFNMNLPSSSSTPSSSSSHLNASQAQMMAALAAMGHQMPNSSNPGGGGGGFPQMPQNLTREQLANLLAQQPNQQLQQHLIQQQLLQQQANHVQQQQQQHLNAGHGQEAFPSGGISGAQAALAASQAAAMNRVGTTPGPSSQGQQQQPRPPVAHNASSAKMLQQFPDEVKELAANITDQQLTQWVDKAKRGEFSDHQKAQLQMILQLRHHVHSRQTGAETPANQPRPPSGNAPNQPMQQQPSQQQPMNQGMLNQQQQQQQQQQQFAQQQQQQRLLWQQQQQQAGLMNQVRPPNATLQGLQNYNMTGSPAQPPANLQQQQLQQQQQQQNNNAGSNPRPPPPAGAAGGTAANQLLMMQQMAQQNPSRVIQAFTMRMKDLDMKINSPQSTPEQKQAFGQQLADLKRSLQEIAQNMGGLGVNKLGEGSGMTSQQPNQRPPSAQGGLDQQPGQRPPTQMYSSPAVRPGVLGGPQQQQQQQQQNSPMLAGQGQMQGNQQPSQSAGGQWQQPPNPQQQQDQRPPTGQQPPLALKQEQFQRALADILPRNGITMDKPVIVGGQQIDLWTLYQAVAERGGMQAVTQTNAWTSVVVAIGLAQHGTAAAYALAQPLMETYRTYLMAFEGVWQRAVQSVNPAAVRAKQEQAQQQQQQQQQPPSVQQSMPPSANQPAPQTPQQQMQQHMMAQAGGQARPPVMNHLQAQQQAMRFGMSPPGQSQLASSPQMMPPGPQQGQQQRPPPQPQQQRQQQQPPQQPAQQQAQQANQANRVDPGPVPKVSAEQLQSYGLSMAQFADLWQSGFFLKTHHQQQQQPQPQLQMPMNMQVSVQPQQAANNMTAMPQGAGQAFVPSQHQQAASAPQQPNTSSQQPFAAGPAASASLPQSQPHPHGEARHIAVTKEQFDDAKEQLRKVDEELVHRRPDLRAPEPLKEEEKEGVFKFVATLSSMCDECNVLLPAFYAMNGGPLETSGAKRAKIMLWMMRDQVLAMKRGESVMAIEDLKKMAHHFQRIIHFVRTSNPQVAEFLIKEHLAAKSAGAPSFVLGQTFLQAQPQASQQQAGQSNGAGAGGLQPPLKLASPSIPAAGVAGSMPVNDFMAAQLGIKRGLRIDDLKLPPNKRGKQPSAVSGSGPSTTTPGNSAATPINLAGSPSAMDSSPAAAKNESPRLNSAASPAASGAARGGKRAQSGGNAASRATARGGKKKGGLNERGEMAPSPKIIKAKTSADIMAEVKAEVAAAEAEKRRKEESKATVGIEDPSKNPVHLTEAEASAKEQREQGLMSADPIGFVESSWQDLLMVNSTSQGANGSNTFTSTTFVDPLQAILAKVNGSVPSFAASGLVGSVDSTQVGDIVGSSSDVNDMSNDAADFFDFELFDFSNKDGETGEKSADTATGADDVNGTAASKGEGSRNEAAEALGIASVVSSSDMETPELVASGIPSTGSSSSTSSSMVLLPKTASISQLFDDPGTGGLASKTTTMTIAETPEDIEHQTPANGVAILPDSDSKLQGQPQQGGKVSESITPLENNLGDDFWNTDYSSLFGSGSEDKAWAVLTS